MLMNMEFTHLEKTERKDYIFFSLMQFFNLNFQIQNYCHQEKKNFGRRIIFLYPYLEANYFSLLVMSPQLVFCIFLFSCCTAISNTTKYVLIFLMSSLSWTRFSRDEQYFLKEIWKIFSHMSQKVYKIPLYSLSFYISSNISLNQTLYLLVLRYYTYIKYICIAQKKKTLRTEERK